MSPGLITLWAGTMTDTVEIEMILKFLANEEIDENQKVEGRAYLEKARQSLADKTKER